MKLLIGIFINIASIIALILFFIWVGIKGILSFFIGMLLMAFIIYSKMPFIEGIFDYLGVDKNRNK